MKPHFYSRIFLNEALVAPNVVVLRTFSKLMSLAAVRLGVIVGNSVDDTVCGHGVKIFTVNS